MNRRDRRIYEKELKKKVTRKIDWGKVAKAFKSVITIGLIFSLLIFCFSYYVITEHNNIRKLISLNAKTADAKVISISGKMHYATYEYFVKGKRYENSTFNRYEGKIGNEIGIEYSLENPTYSVFCKEKEIEDIKENVFFYTLKMFGIMVVFSILYILLGLLFGNKKLMSEITYRNNYHSKV